MFTDEVYTPEALLSPALALLERMGIGHIDIRRVNGVDSVIDVDDDLDAAVRLQGSTLSRWRRLVGRPFSSARFMENEGPAGRPPRHWSQNRLPALHGPAATDLHARGEIGTRKIRCFAFWRQHRLDDVFDEVVEKLGRAADLAKASGFQLLLENEHNTLAGTGVEQARILKAINNQSIRVSTTKVIPAASTATSRRTTRRCAAGSDTSTSSIAGRRDLRLAHRHPAYSTW